MQQSSQTELTELLSEVRSVELTKLLEYFAMDRMGYKRDYDRYRLELPAPYSCNYFQTVELFRKIQEETRLLKEINESQNHGFCFVPEEIPSFEACEKGSCSCYRAAVSDSLIQTSSSSAHTSREDEDSSSSSSVSSESSSSEDREMSRSSEDSEASTSAGPKCKVKKWRIAEIHENTALMKQINMTAVDPKTFNKFVNPCR